MTLNQQLRSCGRRLYRTGIPNIQVIVLEDKEEFLDNKHLGLSNRNGRRNNDRVGD